MSNISYLKGDATDPARSGPQIICHVCNDNGGWGKGFVLALSKRWSKPESEYRLWHKRGSVGGFELGAIQVVDVEPNLAVANMIAQRGVRPSGGVPPIRYEALRECLAKLSEHAARTGASIHMPRIGCGLAGGTWQEVEAIIRATLSPAAIHVYVYDL